MFQVLFYGNVKMENGYFLNTELDLELSYRPKISICQFFQCKYLHMGFGQRIFWKSVKLKQPYAHRQCVMFFKWGLCFKIIGKKG